ncbi:Ca2+/calmodulin-dependent protein kinase, EF-Hand protein superfamily [Ectocarpus siliculosus]|uniref:non-specific serine/threonine protein kinase n=1 Tax=Ectocarpus siliculosus TaxID=2880 RepID=D7G6A3_ECTSI|nr:Ca2+/calmodulin-dependent protein kinase, EF-Hand protein superfamily [Ectocarpus siliculosus]|eukprot:CBJ27498.1 Ca2+/calmodulin-dependent protein kinase, EF-Hand protein superfamily [Ectocarpus siliculosus]
MREVNHFLLELKNGSESRGEGVICEIPHSAPANEVRAGSGLGPSSAENTGLDPLQSASPDTKGGRQLLLDAALEAMKVAEDPSTKGDRVLMARSFHTATVYLEVLSSFNALGPEHERQLQYTKWRTYQCSHLLENIKHEFLETEGRVDDHYFLEKDKELGRGTYGRVIQATHRGTGRQYACKVVHVTRMEPRQVSKLFSEVSVLRELDHPHIVRMRQVFYSKRHIYMIMDLATGGELFHLVTKNPGDCATEPEIRRMLTNMLSAVGYMHRHGIVHRDLKLENWLMQTPGDTTAVKLIDFGLSKHFTLDQNMQQAVGSTYYVAPEVLQGSYGPKCDMWSMGVIAYMMVSGAPPFWGNGDAQVRAKIVCGEYDMPDVLFQHISSDAKDFITKLLVVDPKERLSAEQALAHPWLRRPSSSLADVGTAKRGSPPRRLFAGCTSVYVGGYVGAEAPCVLGPFGGPSSTVVESVSAGQHSRRALTAPRSPARCVLIVTTG